MKKYLRLCLLLALCCFIISLHITASDIITPYDVTVCQGGCKTLENYTCTNGGYAVGRSHTFQHMGNTGTCNYYEVWSDHYGYCVTCGRANFAGSHLHQVYGHTPSVCGAYNEYPPCPY